MRSIFALSLVALALAQSSRATVSIDPFASNMGVEITSTHVTGFAYLASFSGQPQGEVSAQIGQLPNGTLLPGGASGTTGFTLSQSSGWINYRTEASVLFNYPSPAEGVNCYSIFNFEVNEPTAYTIAGEFEGQTLAGGADWHTHVSLRSLSAGSSLGLFSDASRSATPTQVFDHVIGSGPSPDVSGSLTGWLAPGAYEFALSFFDGAPTASGEGHGWATFALQGAILQQAPIPETGSAWLGAAILLPLGVHSVRRCRSGSTSAGGLFLQEIF